jgi:antitoxin HigA-1
MAKGLGVSRKQVSSIINQRSGISPEMAVRLSEAFGTSVELWTNLQRRYDAYQAQKKVSREGIKRFYPETQA